MSNLNQKTIKLLATVGFVMVGLMSEVSALHGKFRCTKLAKESAKCATDLNFYNEFKKTCEIQQPIIFGSCQKAKCQHELEKLKKLVVEKIDKKEKIDPTQFQILFEPYTQIGCPRSDLAELEGMVGLHGFAKGKAEAPHWGIEPQKSEQKMILGGKRKATSKENIAEQGHGHAAPPQHEAAASQPPAPPTPPAPAPLPGGPLHIQKKPGAAQPATDPAASLENEKRSALLKRRGALADSGNISMDESED